MKFCQHSEFMVFMSLFNNRKTLSFFVIKKNTHLYNLGRFMIQYSSTYSLMPKRIIPLKKKKEIRYLRFLCVAQSCATSFRCSMGSWIKWSYGKYAGHACGWHCGLPPFQLDLPQLLLGAKPARNLDQKTVPRMTPFPSGQAAVS